MPAANTIGEQILEAAVAGPDQANRLFAVTGAANVGMFVGSAQQQTTTWTCLVGPTLARPQFYRAIGTAAITDQTITGSAGAGASYRVAITSVEADWDDESGRVEVRVEIFASVPTSVQLNISQFRYWVTILAQLPSS